MFIFIEVISIYNKPNSFLLVGNLDFPMWGKWLLSFSTFAFQIHLFSTYALITRPRYMMLASLLYSAVKQALSLTAIPPFILSGVLPYILMIAYGFRKQAFKKTLFRVLKLYVVVGVYQGMSEVIKLGAFKLGYSVLEPYQFVLWNTELVILLFVISMKGGSSYARDRFYNLFPGGGQSLRARHQSGENVQAYDELHGLERVISRFAVYGYQLFQWALILIVCALGSVFIEGLIISSAFALYGLIIKNRWHSKSLVACTFASINMIAMPALLIPSFKYSQFLPIIIGFIIVYGLYRAALYQQDLQNALSTLDKVSRTCKEV
jgi:hypothetical protein